MAEAAPTDVPAATRQFLEVLCDRYELRTNVAVFYGPVRVNDWNGGQAQGQMTCGLLTLTLGATNELQRLVAERDVVIVQADRRFTAARAEYTAGDRLLKLTGQPAWQDGPRAGRGDWMQVDLAREELSVRGNAVMKLPAGEVGQAVLTGAEAARPVETRPGADGSAEIHSREYRFTERTALFEGGVRIEHPQMQWTCDRLSLTSPPELGPGGRRMVAEPAVVFDLLSEPGNPVHGTGERAVYTRRLAAARTNDFIELHGTPAMMASSNLVIRNELIVLDISGRKLATPGKFNFRGPLPAAMTNHFRPEKRR